MHILLIRFSSMGDVVLQTATINWLRSLFGNALTITFVTASEFASLVESHPGVNHVITFDRKKGEKWDDLLGKIRELDDRKPISLILDLHATLRSFRLKLSLWDIPALTIDKRRWERFFLVKIKSVKLKHLLDSKIFGLEPQVQRILKDFEHIFHDHRASRRTSDFRHGPHHELTSLSPLPEYELPHPYIVIAPSASFLYKRWPVENFVTLVENLLNVTNHHFVVLAGPGDDFCQAFNRLDSSRVINLQGKTSLKESMSVLERAALCVGNDSGMNHIAEAYGVPCLTMFGPTDPKFGFIPHGSKSRFLSKSLFCKPCSTTGKTPCYRDRHYCMEDISVNEVKTNVLEMIQ